MLFVLLFVGWTTGCPVSAQTIVDVVPDPSTNLTGTDNGSVVQPLEMLNVADYGVTFTFSNKGGGTAPAYYRNGNNVRLYRGNTFTMESSKYIVERVEFQSVAYRSTASTLSVDIEGDSISYDKETLIYTWENTSHCQNASFRINDTQLRISSIKLTLMSEGEVTILKVPVFSQKSGEFYKSFQLTISDINEPSATIYYTMDGSIPSAENGTKYIEPITIPIGNDVTVKAVSVSGDNTSLVASATYHFIAKHLFSLKLPNKNGVDYMYYSSNTDYGEWSDDNSTFINDGDNLHIGFNLNSGYTCKEIKLNGVTQCVSGNSLNFVMPETDVELIIDAVFDPSSPSDPQPGDTTKKYSLYLTSNPIGAASLSGDGVYAAGSAINLNANSQSGYIFTGWTKDGETISTSSSFYYTMPSSDVVLTANYIYNPSSPSDPQQPALKHPLSVIASPAGAGTFSISSSEVTYGQEFYVYAYPQTGYKFKGWIVNGIAQEETSTRLNGIMTDAGAQVVGLFVFDPTSPSNPGANYFNSTSGQVIIDDFTQGNLYSVLRDLVGNDNYGNVSSIIVKGIMSSNDYGTFKSLTNAVTIDISRTGGVTAVPGYAFQDLAAANIHLPSTIANLGNYVFRNCSNLTALTVYAQVPPKCGSSTFNGFTNKDNCTVFVPSEAIELYNSADYWKDFTILPITDDAHVLQVNLPADATDGRYKNNSIELVNLNSGVRQKYVISDRLLYTYNGLRKDEQYNIYMLSQAGLELGRIENVTVPDADFEVTFDNLKSVYNVNAVVLTPDGKDVASDVTVEWLKPLADGTLTYLRKSTSLGEIPEGQALLCRVTLNNQLGMLYAMPEDTEFTVDNEQNTCTINLVPFRSIALSGTVVDGDGAALSDASVAVNQTLNGKFSKSYSTKTDSQGKWKLSVLDAPETRFTYSAIECVNVNDTIGAFEPVVSSLDLGKTTLKSIVGARVTYGFTYHAAGSEDVQDYYSDYQNVLISVFNVTQNRAHNEISLQYPILAVLDENINPGDVLRLTATSKKGAFNPIDETVTVGEDQRAEATFDIVGKGGIAASFEMTDNPAVIAMLYSSRGELLKNQTFLEGYTTFTELEDGDYTLVSMGQSDFMNSILRLSNFSEIGLTEGKDYIKNAVTVESGKLSEVKNTEIPAFDESLFYYTNSSTSFSSNKSSITTGNYLTLRAAIDFKGVYKNGISNVALVVDLPEACDFVEQSVIQGPNLLPYTLDNNRLTVQLGNAYTAQTRFCVIPTNGGSFNATASIVFDYNGKTSTQPIGSASSEIKDIEITVPSVIAGTTFKVSGTALGNSKVDIYEDGTLLGRGKANAAGSWNVACELTGAYNLSTHSICARITTPADNTLTSETKTLTYDINALQVSKVTMYHWNPEMHKTYVSEFDFLNPKTSATQWTVYYPKKQFTYTIEFTDNDPERISNVILYVHTADGKFVPVNAFFDEQKGMWYAEIDMGTSSNGYYPVNCSVDFDYINTNRTIDRSEIDDIFKKDGDFLYQYSDLYEKIINILENNVQLTDDEWEQFYAENNLGLNDDDYNSVDFPADFDSWSEEEQISYLNDLSNQLNQRLEVFTQDFTPYQSLFNYDSNESSIQFGDGSAINVKSCDGITVDSLLEQGFEEIECANGSKMYFLIGEERSIFVDFENNICVETNGAMLQTLGLGDDFMSLLRSLRNIYTQWNDSNVGLCINLLDQIKGVFENANLKCSTLIKNVEVELWFKVDKWLTDLTNQQQVARRMLTKAPNSAMALVYRSQLNDILAKKALVSAFKSCIKPACKLLSRSLPIANWISITADLINKAIDIRSIYKLIDDKTCLSESQKTDFRGRNKGILWQVGAYAAGTIIPTAIGDAEIFVGVLGTMETAGGSLGVSVMGFIVKSVAQITSLCLDNMISSRIKELREEINAIKCPDDTSGGNGGNGGNKPGGGAHQSGSPGDGVQIDPSGYVYEAVPENRVEGVQATIYYKETKEDMYGDPYEEIVLWNAEEYAQQNPLFTDENGMYRWDVPQGLWQVKFEREGYVTAYSEWLPVPPPQLEVNIGIVQNKQPEVTEARAYEEGVEVQFDKFMDLSTLTTDNIYVTANGEKLNGSIRLIDSALADEYADEEDESATRYASRVRFVPEESLSATTGEIRVTVSRNVLSYARIPMTETFTQVLDVEKEVQIITADDVKVLYGGEKEVTVYALPYEAAVGRTLRIVNSSELITSVDKTEATIDEEGKATVIVKGDLPGRAQLTFSIDDVTVTGECAVDVVTEIINAEAPKSSRASGTAVYRGTKVELTTESKDGVIYFTTDGSCPCDENGTRRKYTVPIIINEDTKILAMTSVGTGDDDVSETVEFNYTLKRSDMDFAMDEGWTWISHNFESPVAVTTLAADENVQRIMSQTREVIRDPQLGMVGMLQELNASESYKVETSSKTSRQRLSEIAWNPATPIALNTGWNWLGYPVSQTMSVDEAFAPTSAENLDVIVGQNGFAQFDGESWVGTLETLSPGLGYMYQSRSPKEVVYNTSIVSTASGRYAAGISQNSPLVLDIHKYPSVMPVVATVNDVDGTDLDDEDYQVNAFCGSECRGIGRVVNGHVMMNVYGNANDNITFQVTDKEGVVEFTNDESMMFGEKVVGSLDAPYAISINSRSGIRDVAYDGNIKVSVVGDMLVIKGIAAGDIDLVEVYDTEGRKLIRETKVSESGVRVSQLNTGVYVVIVNGNGEYTYHKIALR